MARLYKRHPIGDHNAVRAALGLPPKAKLPPKGLGPVSFKDYTLWVNPLSTKPFRWKRSTHRAMANCHACGWVGSAGRLHQHVCKVGGAR